MTGGSPEAILLHEDQNHTQEIVKQRARPPVHSEVYHANQSLPASESLFASEKKKYLSYCYLKFVLEVTNAT